MSVPTLEETMRSMLQQAVRKQAEAMGGGGAIPAISAMGLSPKAPAAPAMPAAIKPVANAVGSVGSAVASGLMKQGPK